MAANDYYNNSYSMSGGRDGHNRTDAPLPPVAHNHSNTSISPVSSPFDDQHHYEYPSTSNLAAHSQPMGHGGAYNDTTYHGAQAQSPYGTPGAHTHSSDPFADQNAIPLQAQAKMDGSPTRYAADPEGRMYPVGRQPSRKRKKKGLFSGRVTWVVYILTVVQIGVFIGELIKNAILTKSPIEIHPTFNIMIGPSPYVLINMGARYPPCMHNVHNVTDYPVAYNWPCPNMTDSNVIECSLSDLCGMGGVPYQAPGTSLSDTSHEPNQWWRFIVPIFLHAGIVHIGFNMLLQMTLGRDMEKEIGSLRFALVYFSSGIFGFVLGGNYAAPGIASTGASGALFGILALTLIDLLYNWGTRRSPVKDLLFILLDVAISFVLGLLPGLDNFSHIGGFIMGLALGVCLMRSPAPLRQRIGQDEPPYSAVEHAQASGSKPAITQLAKQPVGFFKGRKPLWWAWWLFRAGALVAVFIGFILLLKNFYVWRNECTWCHHLSCLPIKNWCDIGNIQPQNETTSYVTKRAIPTSVPVNLARDIFLPRAAAAVPTGIVL